MYNLVSFQVYTCISANWFWFIHYLYTLYTLFIHSLYAIYTQFIHSLYTLYTLFIHYIFIHSLYILYALFLHSFMHCFFYTLALLFQRHLVSALVASIFTYVFHRLCTLLFKHIWSLSNCCLVFSWHQLHINLTSGVFGGLSNRYFISGYLILDQNQNFHTLTWQRAPASWSRSVCETGTKRHVFFQITAFK